MRTQQLLLLLFALLIGIGPAFAQAGKGTIKGTVLLSNAKPAAGVTVHIEDLDKDQATDENGRFTIRQVAAGTHELSITVPGYSPDRKQVTVAENETATVSFSLALSQQELNEVVVRSGSAYKAEAPSSSLRIAEPLLEAPQNIQVITNKVLADQQITSLSDGVIRNVSGVTRLEHWGDSYTRINMRGSRASAFRNGMNVTSTWGPLTEDMSFVDHIEFVKGPAGFMMSNGEPSGIYNVVTKKPTGETKGEVGLMMGSYDFYRATLDLDGKLDKAGKVLYRVNLMDQTKNSFRAYEYNDRYSIAPVLSYKIDDQTTLTAEYVLQHAKTSNVGSYYVFSTQGYGVVPRDFTLSDPNLEPTKINDHSVTLNLQHYFTPNWKITAQAAYYNYQLRGSSIWPTSVDSAGNMIRSVSIWDASNISKFGQVYLNGDAQTGGIHHRVLAGLDMGDKQYLADWNQSHNLDSAGAYFNIYHPTYGYPANGYPSFNREKPLQERAGLGGTIAQQYTGLYAQDELGFLDNKVRLTLAGRYTYVKDNSYGTITTGKRFTPRIGLSVSPNKETSIYALYDQTFVPQSGIRRDAKAVSPLTGNNMEVGVKKDWFDGKWNTTIAVYQILKNKETSADPANTPGENYVVQFGQTKTRGLEFDVRGQILPGLSIVANYAYTDSKISKADSSESAQLTIGNKVPGYATHTANAWLTYRIQSGILKGLGINGGFTFLSDRTTWSWGDAGTLNLPDYFKLDGGLSYEKKRFTITANIFNILDKYLYSGAYYGYGGYYYWQAEAGRNLRFGVNYRF